MQKHSVKKAIDRIIDANINRSKEGLRVCEEITRFILNNPSLTARFKEARHRIDSALALGGKSRIEIIRQRDSLNDVGRRICINEFKRSGYPDIFFANIQRVKESVRVLEEFSKLGNRNAALRFKEIRYRIYEIEKKAVGEFSALRNYR